MKPTLLLRRITPVVPALLALTSLLACGTAAPENEGAPQGASASAPAATTTPQAAPGCQVMHAEVERGFVADLQQALAAGGTAQHVPGALRARGSYGHEVLVTSMFAQMNGSSLFLADQAGQRDSDFKRTPRNESNVLAAHTLFDAMAAVPTSTETASGFVSEVRRSPGGRIVCKHIPDQTPVIEESWTCEILGLKTAYVTAAPSSFVGLDCP